MEFTLRCHFNFIDSVLSLNLLTLSSIWVIWHLFRWHHQLIILDDIVNKIEMTLRGEFHLMAGKGKGEANKSFLFPWRRGERSLLLLLGTRERDLISTAFYCLPMCACRFLQTGEKWKYYYAMHMGKRDSQQQSVCCIGTS